MLQKSLTTAIFNSMFSKLQKDAKNIVSESVSSINEDDLQKVISSKSMESDEYRKIQQSMVRYKNDRDIKYLYTLIKGKDNKAYILVDASIVDLSPLGEEFHLEDEMIEAFNGNITFTKNPIPDKYGTFISAYAQIKNSSGQVIAIVGGDKDVSNFLYIKSYFLKVTLILAVILILLSIILSKLLSKKISLGVKCVTDELNKMSEGDLTVVVSANTGDEIQAIAESADNVRMSTAETLSKLKQTCETVNEQIDNLSSSSEEMAKSSEEVAATIQEVAKGMNLQSDEMTNINDIMNDFGIKN